MYKKHKYRKEEKYQQIFFAVYIQQLFRIKVRKLQVTAILPAVPKRDNANLGCQVRQHVKSTASRQFHKDRRDEMQSWGADCRKTTQQQQQLGVNNQDVTGREDTSLAAEIKHYSLLFLARVRSVQSIIFFHFPS